MKIVRKGAFDGSVGVPLDKQLLIGCGLWLCAGLCSETLADENPYSVAHGRDLHATNTLKVLLPKGVRMDFVWVPPARKRDTVATLQTRNTRVNRPQSMQGFWVGKFEVTQDQYEVLTGENPSRFREPRLPVHGVTWNNAVRFCRLLTKHLADQIQRPLAASLPIEAEWELACATDGELYCGGSDESDLAAVGIYRANSQGKPAFVGSKRPNKFGLHDMHGNVWEWCNEPYRKDGFARDPSGGSIRPLHGAYRVCKGGAWESAPKMCSAKCRDVRRPGTVCDLIGFRVVLIEAGQSAERR